MTLSSKPVRVGKATYLRVPKECEDLVPVMEAKNCTVDLQISDKGYSLVYTFARPIPELLEDVPRRPLWLMKREMVVVMGRKALT